MPRMGVYKETDGEVGSGNKEGVKIRPDRTPTRSVIRLDIRKKKGAGADQPTPTRKRAESAELVRSSMITEKRRPKRNPINRDRSGQGLCRHEWRLRFTSHNTQLEPVSARRPIGHDDYGSVED